MWGSPARSYCDAHTHVGVHGPGRWEKIMAFDDYTLNAALRATDSFNQTEENTLTSTVTVSDSGNTDDSVNDSFNDDTVVDGSYHWGSNNTEMDIEDSGNEGSYNDFFEWTDNSVEDNSDNSVNDNSVNAGVRSYNTGFGDITGAATAAAAGDGTVFIDNRSTIADQSVNGNTVAFGPVFQTVSNDALVASGDDAVVAGDDYRPEYNIDQSTTMFARGDILIDSEKTENIAINSGNTYDFSYSYTDESIEVDIEDSGNTYSWSETVTDSYNDSFELFEETNVNVDIDAIVGSFGAGIADDVEIDL